MQCSDWLDQFACEKSEKLSSAKHRPHIYNMLLCNTQYEGNCADNLSEDYTCAECEEKEFHLLAFGEQLNEVELERNHVDVLLGDQMFSCLYT